MIFELITVQLDFVFRRILTAGINYNFIRIFFIYNVNFGPLKKLNKEINDGKLGGNLPTLSHSRGFCINNMDLLRVKKAIEPNTGDDLCENVVLKFISFKIFNIKKMSLKNINYPF